MMLAMAQSGEKFVVQKILCECKIKKMLQERGLTEGVNIKVVKGQLKGPFIIEFRSSRIMLDDMCARKIIVNKLKGDEDEKFERCKAWRSCYGCRGKRRRNV